MKFSDFKGFVKSVAFPIGEPENLTVVHDAFIVEALAEIQKYVPCYRTRNVNRIVFPDTRYNGGLTVVGAPDGVINRVYTVGEHDFTCKVNYRRSTLARLRAMEASNRLSTEAAVLPTQPTDKKPLDGGDLYADQNSDSSFGRATRGYWAIEGCRIYMWPHIQSGEDVVIEWSGVKSSYADTDEVFDQRAASAVRAALLRDIARNVDYSDSDALRFDAIYRERLSELYHWCRLKLEGNHAEEDTIQPVTNGCVLTNNVANEGKQDSDEQTVQTEIVETVFAIVGNYGTKTGGSLAVADLINGWSPSYIVTTGGNNMLGVPTVAGYDDVVGRYFHNNIFPYAGSFGAGAVDYNRLWPTIDDFDSASFTAYDTFFKLPETSNGRYYERVEGPVHLFFVDTTTGDTTSSAQAEWLRLSLSKSISPFKIVVMNKPPYSSVGGPGVITISDNDPGDIGLSGVDYTVVRDGALLTSGFLHYQQSVDVPISATSDTLVNFVRFADSHTFAAGVSGTAIWEAGTVGSYATVDATDVIATNMQWPFKQWGATIVVDGSPRVYERINIGGIMYLTSGLGGISLGQFPTTPIGGSQSRYVANYGAIKGTVTCDQLKLDFVSVDGVTQDSITLHKATS